MIDKMHKQNKDIILSYIFPDTITVRKRAGDNRTTNEYGVIVEDVPTLREYNNSVNIPCRIDTLHSFREVGIPEQPMDLEDYTIELPHDFYIHTTDIIIIDNKDYEIRKIIQASTWHLTKTITVTGLNDDKD